MLFTDALRVESYEGQILNGIFARTQLSVTHQAMEPPSGYSPVSKGTVGMDILHHLYNTCVQSLAYGLTVIRVGKNQVKSSEIAPLQSSTKIVNQKQYHVPPPQNSRD